MKRNNHRGRDMITLQLRLRNGDAVVVLSDGRTILNAHQVDADMAELFMEPGTISDWATLPPNARPKGPVDKYGDLVATWECDEHGVYGEPDDYELFAHNPGALRKVVLTHLDAEYAERLLDGFSIH